jgi:hypothetical protein
MHKNMAKQKPSSVHRHLNDIGWENVRIVLIKNVAAQTKDQLLMVEQYCIDRLKPELNKQSAYVDCPHGRQHSECIDCGGAGICEHNRVKSKCVQCGGSQICEHNKRKSTCVQCGGSQICEHNRNKTTCKHCNGDKYKCGVCDYTAGSAGGLKSHRKSATHLTKLYAALEARLNSYSLTG